MRGLGERILIDDEENFQVGMTPEIGVTLNLLDTTVDLRVCPVGGLTLTFKNEAMNT